MKKVALLQILTLVAGLVMAAAAPAKTWGYPSADDASFLVDMPDEWTMEPAESAGDYVHFNSDSGVYLAFRTIEGSKDSGMAAMEDSITYVKENYMDAQLSEPRETQQAGMPAFLIDGTGKESDGTPVVFRLAFIKLEDGNLAEVWFAAHADDEDGINAAGAALSSFRAP